MQPRTVVPPAILLLFLDYFFEFQMISRAISLIHPESGENIYTLIIIIASVASIWRIIGGTKTKIDEDS